MVGDADQIAWLHRKTAAVGVRDDRRTKVVVGGVGVGHQVVAGQLLSIGVDRDPVGTDGRPILSIHRDHNIGDDEPLIMGTKHG